METENIATLFKFAIKENRETGTVTIGYRLGEVSIRWEILGHSLCTGKIWQRENVQCRENVTPGAKSLNKWEEMGPGA